MGDLKMIQKENIWQKQTRKKKNILDEINGKTRLAVENILSSLKSQL